MNCRTKRVLSSSHPHSIPVFPLKTNKYVRARTYAQGALERRYRNEAAASSLERGASGGGGGGGRGGREDIQSTANGPAEISSAVREAEEMLASSQTALADARAALKHARAALQGHRALEMAGEVSLW